MTNLESGSHLAGSEGMSAKRKGEGAVAGDDQCDTTLDRRELKNGKNANGDENRGPGVMPTVSRTVAVWKHISRGFDV